MARARRETLARRWTRAQEQDSEGCIVFRPSGADLPPVRAPRIGLELTPDGVARRLAAGPADTRVAQEGTWELVGDELRLRVGDGPERRYGIEHADERELRLRELG